MFLPFTPAAHAALLLDSSRPFGLLQEEIDRKEKMATVLNQTVRELQQLIQAVNRQLTRGPEAVRPRFLFDFLPFGFVI